MKEETKNINIESHLTFKIADEIFAINVKNVLNILEMTKITHVPQAPNYMKGVINLRGSVLPIIDTRLKFGMEEIEATTNTCILVMEITQKKSNLKFGAVVDSVQEVIEFGSNDIQQPPTLGTKYQNDFITGMVKNDERFIMIINVEKVFGTDEIVNIKDIGADVKDLQVIE